MARKYIGVIYWNDEPHTVMDNTTVDCYSQVLKQCCMAHPLYAGRMCIYPYKEKFMTEDGIDHCPIKEFVDVEDAKNCYRKTFNEEPPARHK